MYRIGFLLKFHSYSLQPGDSWDCMVSCTRFSCFDNDLIETKLSNCLPKLPAPAAAFIESVEEYPSYTAFSEDYETGLPFLSEDKVDIFVYEEQEKPKLHVGFIFKLKNGVH